MEYKMLVNAIPIIEFDEFKSNGNSFTSVIGVCVNFDYLQLQETCQTFLNLTTPHFICIKFSDLENIDKTNLLENLRNLVLCSFNINYIKTDNNPVIALLYSEYNKDIKNYIFEIKNEFAKQGYDNMFIYELNENNANLFENTEYLFITNEIEKNKSDSFCNLFCYENIINKMIFVYSTIDKAKSIIEQINNIEKSFANTDNKFYSSLQSIQNLKTENKVLQNENKVLNSQIQNYEIIQKLLRKDSNNIIDWHKEEIKKIKNWYYIQYEILPLWYKRIGHIIKKCLKCKVP